MKGRRFHLRREIAFAVVALVVAAGTAIGLVMIRSAKPKQPVASTLAPDRALVEPPRVDAIVPPQSRDVQLTPSIAPPPILPSRANAQRPATKATSPEPAALAKRTEQPKPRRTSKKDGPDRPLARQALDLVGADPIAEAAWAEAINDPTVSPHDRQDLIEDLNENGFDDPAHPSADDLPIIENRIALIEQLAPFSMDDVNAAAFAEAYKDLINMHGKALAD